MKTGFLYSMAGAVCLQLLWPVAAKAAAGNVDADTARVVHHSFEAGGASYDAVLVIREGRGVIQNVSGLVAVNKELLTDSVSLKFDNNSTWIEVSGVRVVFTSNLVLCQTTPSKSLVTLVIPADLVARYEWSRMQRWLGHELGLINESRPSR